MSGSDPVTRLNAALEGRYAIERELGEGGMATVYLGRPGAESRYVIVQNFFEELRQRVGN